VALYCFILVQNSCSPPPLFFSSPPPFLHGFVKPRSLFLPVIFILWVIEVPPPLSRRTAPVFRSLTSIKEALSPLQGRVQNRIFFFLVSSPFAAGQAMMFFKAFWERRRRFEDLCSPAPFFPFFMAADFSKAPFPALRPFVGVGAPVRRPGGNFFSWQALASFSGVLQSRRQFCGLALRRQERSRCDFFSLRSLLDLGSHLIPLHKR